VKRGKAIKEKNQTERQDADDFLELLNSEWTNNIGKLHSYIIYIYYLYIYNIWYSDIWSANWQHCFV